LDTDPNTIEAEAYYYDPAKDRFFIKISFLGTGMYINSFSVQPSKYEDKPIWVQPPKHRQGSGWTPTVDFVKSYPLWRIIEQKAIEATKHYKAEEKRVSKKDTVIRDIPDGPINLDDIQF
jgi:hypothetical protein